MFVRSLLNEAQESIQRIKSTYSCQICLGPSVTHVMTPCGHTICGECLGRMQSNKYVDSIFTSYDYSSDVHFAVPISPIVSNYSLVKMRNKMKISRQKNK